jgi:hypothetical protein
MNDNSNTARRLDLEEAASSSTEYYMGQMSVEVCQGPDCTGLGGGAAVLDIEELVQEAVELGSGLPSSINPVIPPVLIVAGGCRDLCTMGPNVYLRGGALGTIESFNKVDSPSRCGHVARAVKLIYEGRSLKNGEDTEESGSALPVTTQSMMLRRSERMRWEALRRVSRIVATCRKDALNGLQPSQVRLDTRKEFCEEQLSVATKAELSATSSSGLLSERARRRANRLVQLICNALDEACTKRDLLDGESSSSSGDSGDEDSRVSAEE